MREVELPILLASVAEQRFECRSCTRCCREFIVQLLDEDVHKLDEQGWAERLDVPPHTGLGKKRVLNKRPDGACVFLQDDGLCRIHAEHGFDAKPITCQLYPFTHVHGDDRWLVAWRFDCPSVAASDGRSMGTYRKLLRRLLPKLPRASARPLTLEMTRGREASAREIDALLQELDGWLGEDTHVLHKRLAAAASLVGTLQQANLSVVKDDRFVELVELLVSDLPNVASELPVEPASPGQQAMFRQLVFAHTEHVTLDEMRSWTTRITRRFRQLGMARGFRRGVGLVPPIPGCEATADFADVETVEPASEESDAIAGMLHRYVRMRLLSHYQFGKAYYGWRVLDGLQALCLSSAVTGWLARFLAASDGHDTIRVEDVVRALAYVDGASGRSPALGSTTERLRLRGLARDEGITRLLRAYRLTDPD